MTRGFIILTTRVCVCVCVDNDEISCFDVECCCHYLHSCHVESKSMSKNLKLTQTNKQTTLVMCLDMISKKKQQQKQESNEKFWNSGFLITIGVSIETSTYPSIEI